MYCTRHGPLCCSCQCRLPTGHPPWPPPSLVSELWVTGEQSVRWVSHTTVRGKVVMQRTCNVRGIWWPFGWALRHPFPSPNITIIIARQNHHHTARRIHCGTLPLRHTPVSSADVTFFKNWICLLYSMGGTLNKIVSNTVFFIYLN